MTEFMLLEELEAKVYGKHSGSVPLWYVGFALESVIKCNEYNGCCDNCKHCETSSPFDPPVPEFLKDCDRVLKRIEGINELRSPDRDT